MALLKQINDEVGTIISTQWRSRTGQVVPSTLNVALGGGAVELNATFLYADLARSSKLAKFLDRRIAAKILKSFLATTTRLIRAHEGTVISFDGDRVLGVFVGDHKNSNAARCALRIYYVVVNVIEAKFKTRYDSVKNLGFRIQHGVGIDTGTVLIVRAGARGSNDLVSIGRAPSLAAKLSDVREPDYRTFITASVYNVLNDASKYADGTDMWERRYFEFSDERVTVYRSNWWWKP